MARLEVTPGRTLGNAPASLYVTAELVILPVVAPFSLPNDASLSARAPGRKTHKMGC